MNLHLEQDRLAESIESLRQDVLFLANTPPISGMVRASANNGIDPRDKDSYAKWETRLQEIFTVFLHAHPEYYQLRFIGAAGEGRELVRVENRAGSVEVAARDALAGKRRSGLFQGGIDADCRPRASVRILPQSGTTGQERRTASPDAACRNHSIRCERACFRHGGDQQGCALVVRFCSGRFAARCAELYQRSVRAISAASRMPSEPSISKRETREILPTIFRSSSRCSRQQTRQGELSSRTLSDGRGGYLAVERMFFDASDPSRFLLLVNHLPAHASAHPLNDASPPNLAFTLLVMILVSGLFMLILRRTFAPLKRITDCGTGDCRRKPAVCA